MAEESNLEKRRLLRDINLMGADYYERFYQQTYLEWKKFISGDTRVDKSIIPQEVFDSWMRCAGLGVDPLSKPENKVMVEEGLDELLLKNKEFIDVSLPFMKNLYRFLEGSGFLVSLFDREAFVLETHR